MAPSPRAADGTEVVSFHSSVEGLDAPPPPPPQGGDEQGDVGGEAAGGGEGAAEELQCQRQTRMYSLRSTMALQELSQLEDRLSSVERRVDDIAATIASAGLESIGALKTELALLEAEAHRLESSGVDNVYTGELASGKGAAKETKKSQLQRLEGLFAQIDALFAEMQRSSEPSGAATLPVPLVAAGAATEQTADMAATLPARSPPSAAPAWAPPPAPARSGLQ